MIFHYRKLIKDILSTKKRCLLLEGKQKDNLEDQITEYIKMQMLPLWPDGWMHLNSLKKVYNNMTETSKSSDNNNSTTNSTKSHSSITITPILNSKGMATSKSDVQNDITLTKITPSEARSNSANSLSGSTKTNSSLAPSKPTSQPCTREGEKPKMERNHDFKIYPVVQSNSHKDEEKPKHKEPDYKKIKHNIVQSGNVINETEKHRYEKDPEYKKNIAISNVIQTGNGGEKLNYEKDHDYKMSVPVDSTTHNRDNELLKSVVDNGVIVINTHKEELSAKIKEEKKEPSAVIQIPKAAHCQVIDLTDVSNLSRKCQPEDRPFDLSKEASGTDLTKPSGSRESYPDLQKVSSKHHELTVTPNFLFTSTPKVPLKSDGDDIQMVMENLKALQKLSSPIKTENSTGSPVSVIAYNKSFSPKSNSSQSSTGQKTEYSGKNDFAGSFQDEFQKQFINSLQQLATSSSSSKSSYNRCS
ncbi:hypothetical protein NQ318_004592 [Aromia moschata]|uniref:Ubinuclein middle domain-containing protein n=1 Tax=Aromia moschata TaxID=1265417 RepID=A0AAV8XR07_9CUCU|nr:hypothetical protein NQ318_004592 [Aromia moschata]